MTTHSAIPIPMTPLIGRDIELIEIDVMLRRPGTRAVSITPKGQAALRSWLGADAWSAVAE